MKACLRKFYSRRLAFTLIELLVSMAVLTLLVVMVTQLINGAVIVTGLSNKHMDADSQARALLDRMGVDIGAMVQRSDVDYFLKGRPVANDQKLGTGSNGNANDQIAFYSEVSGYYPSTGAASPVSLVAYRLNFANCRMERFGKGLVWNGVTAIDITGNPANPIPSPASPMVFLPIPLASALPSPLPSPMPSATPSPAWPQAADASTPDPDYEASGPQVFRFEYYYILKGSSTSNPSIFSDTPWDTRLSHTSVDGLRDVAAIGVAIAVIDPRSRAGVTTGQLQALSGQMNDFSNSMKSGDLEAQWQTVVTASTLPKLSTQGMRIYGRTFYLNSHPQ